jgi:HAD superfamily hydrolase (TIGR01509 family)
MRGNPEGSAARRTAHRDIDAYLFDFGNVVVRFDHWRFCRRLASEAPRGPSAEAIYRSVFSSTLNDEFERGRITGEDLYEVLASELSLEVPVERFKELWCDIFTPNPGMVQLLLSLKGAYRVILVSNTNRWHMEYERSSYPEMFGCFDATVLSYEIGSRKPEPEIFERALVASGTTASRCLYFDDIDSHVQAARRMGMNAVLFRYL